MTQNKTEIANLLTSVRASLTNHTDPFASLIRLTEQQRSIQQQHKQRLEKLKLSRIEEAPKEFKIISETQFTEPNSQDDHPSCDAFSRANSQDISSRVPDLRYLMRSAVPTQSNPGRFKCILIGTAIKQPKIKRLYLQAIKPKNTLQSIIIPVSDYLQKHPEGQGNSILTRPGTTSRTFAAS